MTSLAVVAVALLAIPVAPMAGLGQDVEAEARRAIHAAWTDHIAAVQRSDVDGVMAMYGEDAIYLVPGTEISRGRREIERMEAASMASAEVLEARHATESIRVFGDVAWEVGAVVGRVRPRGEPARRVGFRYMATWRRGSDDAWRVGAMVGEYVPADRPEDPVGARGRDGTG